MSAVMESSTDILGFHGEFEFLSNFHQGHSIILSEDIPWIGTKLPAGFANYSWKTTEHAYQAAKSLNPAHWEAIAMLRYPGEAKKAGGPRGIIGLPRSDWERIKNEIMLNLIRIKFMQYPILQRRLLATGDAKLVEVNTWGDKYWGAVQTLMGLDGQNWLGILLMQLRNELRQSSQAYLH